MVYELFEIIVCFVFSLLLLILYIIVVLILVFVGCENNIFFVFVVKCSFVCLCEWYILVYLRIILIFSVC